MAIFVQSRDKLKVKGKKGIKDLARNARFQFCQNHGCMYFNSFTVFMARTAPQVTFIHPQWTGTSADLAFPAKRRGKKGTVDSAPNTEPGPKSMSLFTALTNDPVEA